MIKAIACGRLTKDATIFSYGQGKTGVNFDLACNTYGVEEPTYIRCTIWNRDENLAQYLKMGDQLTVTGNLSIKAGNDGNYYTSINVDDFDFGAKKSSR